MDTKTFTPATVDGPLVRHPATAETGIGTWRDLWKIDRLLSYVILACGLWTVAVGATQIITSHSLVPLWDEWDEIDAVATAPNHFPPVSWLWSLHNEHRIVFNRLLLLADLHLFHGSHWLGFLSMLAVQTLSLALLAWILRFGGITGTLWRVIVGLAAFALFCPSQWENFGWAFQIAFLLPVFFTFLAIAALLKYERSARQVGSNWTYVALSVLAASAATYSSAIGVIAWPVLVLLALVLVPRRGAVIAYVLSGVAVIGSYVYHYRGASYDSSSLISVPRPSSPLQSIRHPFAVLEYTAGYLGVIFPPWVSSRESIAVASGALGLALAVVTAAWALRRRRREPVFMVLLALTCFTAATAIITALGRVGMGLDQAFSSRYQTFNLLFWFSVVSLVLLAADKINRSFRTVVIAGIAAVMLLSFVAFPLGLKASRTRTQQAEAAATALLAGVPDKEALRVIYIDPSLIWRDTEYFRQQHLFLFSDLRNDQMGRALSSAYRVAPLRECRGEVSSVKRLTPDELLPGASAGALRLSGWAVNSPKPYPRKFVIAADGNIVGYAASLAGSFTATHAELVRNVNAGEWLGFARPGREASLLDIYAVQGGDHVCRFAVVGIPR